MARGKYSKAISDRSGMEFPYHEMVREWNGSLVHRSEFETKHPQLDPNRTRPDPQALRDPRPEQDLADQRSIQWGWNPVGMRNDYSLTPNDLPATGEIGTVTVVIT